MYSSLFLFALTEKRGLRHFVSNSDILFCVAKQKRGHNFSVPDKGIIAKV